MQDLVAMLPLLLDVLIALAELHQHVLDAVQLALKLGPGAVIVELDDHVHPRARRRHG
jgi:hypothetical protein